MLLSAASLILVVATSGSDFNDLTEKEMKAWKQIQPSIVSIMEGQRVRGTAALISRDGYFLTHATALTGKSVEGRKSDGTAFQLKWIALDDPTQFVLLKADEWNETVTPLTVAATESSKNLLAITPTGPIRAERSKETFGVVNPSQRVMPLSEVLLENNLPTLGGSLLFDLNGQLAGALNASLGMSRDQQSRAGNNRVGGPGGAGGGGFGPDTISKSSVNQYGPGILTAAYTIGPKVLKRVVAGFLSEDRVVKHPAIGVFCRDAVPQGQGALIDRVTEDSPADKAGLQKGDVIMSMNNQAVKSLIDFSRVIANQEIGDTIRIWVRRGSLTQVISVTVGGSQD